MCALLPLGRAEGRQHGRQEQQAGRQRREQTHSRASSRQAAGKTAERAAGSETGAEKSGGHVKDGPVDGEGEWVDPCGRDQRLGRVRLQAAATEA